MITSTNNQKVKEIIQLQKRSSQRKARGLYVAEGKKMFSEADPAQIMQVYVSERFLAGEDERKLLEKQGFETGFPGEGKTELVSDAVMAAMSNTKTPQGILCVLRQKQYRLSDMLKSPAPRLVLLEDLRDPGNLGTILRTAEGAGISGILLSRGCVDIYNPKVIRSTMGSLYRVPFLYMEDTDETVGELKKRRLPLYGAALCDDSVSYETLSYENGCVFMIGNEANGLSGRLLDQADRVVHIPMEGRVESLNASVAAAVLMYESYRQVLEGKRRKRGSLQ